jgi:7-cyano-7-deazaguanine synthase
MDSSTLLLHLLKEGYEVTALSFDYGQKHKVELERAQDLVQFLNSSTSNALYPKITHQVIEIKGLHSLLHSSLVVGGKAVPEGHYEQENMKETVVPNRNKIFSSIIQAVALSLATSGDEKCKVIIAMGIHAGDHMIYPDCRQEFRDVDFQAFKEGNWDSDLVEIYTPYLYVNKFEILQDGLECCARLNIDFDEVYRRTNTSYKPLLCKDPQTGQYEWYSDYKSASSVERVEAFLKLGRPDPVKYADSTGAVNWETVVKHVSQVLTSQSQA